MSTLAYVLHLPLFLSISDISAKFCCKCWYFAPNVLECWSVEVDLNVSFLTIQRGILLLIFASRLFSSLVFFENSTLNELLD